ncbi:golgin subfamily B member 1 isoform X2 [Aethina tumida]|nr:golgin subfamily B member 1 isoform X2 [Aethina tumida]
MNFKQNNMSQPRDLLDDNEFDSQKSSPKIPLKIKLKLVNGDGNVAPIPQPVSLISNGDNKAKIRTRYCKHKKLDQKINMALRKSILISGEFRRISQLPNFELKQERISQALNKMDDGPLERVLNAYESSEISKANRLTGGKSSSSGFLLNSSESNIIQRCSLSRSIGTKCSLASMSKIKMRMKMGKKNNYPPETRNIETPPLIDIMEKTCRFCRNDKFSCTCLEPCPKYLCYKCKDVVRSYSDSHFQLVPFASNVSADLTESEEPVTIGKCKLSVSVGTNSIDKNNNDAIVNILKDYCTKVETIDKDNKALLRQVQLLHISECNKFSNTIFGLENDLLENQGKRCSLEKSLLEKDFLMEKSEQEKASLKDQIKHLVNKLECTDKEIKETEKYRIMYEEIINELSKQKENYNSIIQDFNKVKKERDSYKNQYENLVRYKYEHNKLLAELEATKKNSFEPNEFQQKLGESLTPIGDELAHIKKDIEILKSAKKPYINTVDMCIETDRTRNRNASLSTEEVDSISDFKIDVPFPINRNKQLEMAQAEYKKMEDIAKCIPENPQYVSLLSHLAGLKKRVLQLEVENGKLRANVELKLTQNVNNKVIIQEIEKIKEKKEILEQHLKQETSKRNQLEKNICVNYSL